MSRNQKTTRALLMTATTALATLLLILPGIAPAGQASAGDFFQVFPGRGELLNNAAVTICPASGVNLDLDRYTYAFNDTYDEGDLWIRQTDPSSGIGDLRNTGQDEECASWSLAGQGGRFFSVAFRDAALGGDLHHVTMAIGNASSDGGQAQSAAFDGSTITLDGFTSFDTRLPQLLFLGLLILAYWNRWYAAGTFALAAAIATEFTGGPGILDYTLGYVGFTLFVALEALLSGTKPMRRLRSFFEDRGRDRQEVA